MVKHMLEAGGAHMNTDNDLPNRATERHSLAKLS